MVCRSLNGLGPDYLKSMFTDRRAISNYLRNCEGKLAVPLHCTNFQKSSFSYYYTLNSLSLFWLAERVQRIFEISARDVIIADYTIIMLRTLKVTGNHFMYDRVAWFLRIIMSSSRALCCLASVNLEAKTSSMYNKTIIRFGFCAIQNNRGLSKGYQPQPYASTDSPYLDLDYSGYHKNLIR